MKVAVIGTGAAAFAAIHAIAENKPEQQIHVFDVAAENEPARLATIDHRDWTASDFDEIHQEIKSLVGSGFPPPKTHFAKTIPRFNHEGGRILYKGAEPGGLTKYWSSALLPFTDQDLENYVVDRKTLDPYYRKISEIVGISGRDDDLNTYLGESFANRPPVNISLLTDRLIDSVNSIGRSTNFKFIAGLNRLGIETRDDHPRVPR